MSGNAFGLGMSEIIEEYAKVGIRATDANYMELIYGQIEMTFQQNCLIDIPGNLDPIAKRTILNALYRYLGTFGYTVAMSVDDHATITLLFFRGECDCVHHTA